jgi:hypothetical protein
MAKHHLGHDKEPPSRTRKMGGKGPAVHSHSAKPKRMIKRGGGKKFRA